MNVARNICKLPKFCALNGTILPKRAFHEKSILVMYFNSESLPLKKNPINPKNSYRDRSQGPNRPRCFKVLQTIWANFLAYELTEGRIKVNSQVFSTLLSMTNKISLLTHLTILIVFIKIGVLKLLVCCVYLIVFFCFR